MKTIQFIVNSIVPGAQGSYGDIFVTEDDKAEALVNAGLATIINDLPDTPRELDKEEHLVKKDSSGGTEGEEPAFVPDGRHSVKTWRQYAIDAHDADEEEVEGLTKPQLMSKYGEAL